MAVWVVKCVKTTKATVFWFNNKDIQTIFQDYTELLFSKENITYVNKLGERAYFNSGDLEAQVDEVKKRYKYIRTILQNIKESAKNTKDNKENKPEEVQAPAMVRSSSVLKIEKTQQPVTLRGSASTSRIAPRMLKY